MTSFQRSLKSRQARSRIGQYSHVREVAPAMTETKILSDTPDVSADDRYVVISADTHAVVRKDVFRPYVESRFMSAFDDEVRRAQEERALWMEVYKPLLSHRSESDDADRYYNWNRAAEDAEENEVWKAKNWIEMNAREGVVGSVIFPAGSRSRPPWEGIRPPVADEELREAGKRIYNRWLADFCSEFPQRLAGVAIAPSLEDIHRVVHEVTWAADAGLRGGIWISPRVREDRPGFHDPCYDPIWAICQERNMPVNFHVDFGGGPPPATTLYGTGPLAWPISFHDAQPSYRPLWFMILGGVFERFPRLKVGFTEQLAMWIPYELRRLEDLFRNQSFIAVNRMKSVKELLSLTPVEYWQRNCFVGASFMSRAESEARHQIGIGNILWGSDFPHAEGTSPVTREALRFAFAGLPREEVQLMVGTNAARIYNFDYQAIQTVAANIGPSVTEVAAPLTSPPAIHSDKLVFGHGHF